MTETVNDAPMGSGRNVRDFLSYCEGDIEPSLNKRIYMLIDAEKDYIVYLDDELFVEWSMTDSYGQIPEGFGEIANRTGHLETLSMVLLKPKHIKPFRRLLAEAMARVVGDRDLSKAQECIRMAEAFLKARSLERARTWYFMASFIIAGIASISAILLWVYRNEMTPVIGMNASEVILGALLGGVGGFMSILIRSKAIEMDASAGWQIHYLEGCARVIMGITAALFMALAVKANIVLGITKASDHSLAFLFVVCFVAGWSERFVPSLISRVENLMSEKPGTMTHNETSD